MKRTGASKSLFSASLSLLLLSILSISDSAFAKTAAECLDEKKQAMREAEEDYGVRVSDCCHSAGGMVVTTDSEQRCLKIISALYYIDEEGQRHTITDGVDPYPPEGERRRILHGDEEGVDQEAYEECRDAEIAAAIFRIEEIEAKYQKCLRDSKKTKAKKVEEALGHVKTYMGFLPFLSK